jgi:hypothetical protein
LLIFDRAAINHHPLLEQRRVEGVIERILGSFLNEVIVKEGARKAQGLRFRSGQERLLQLLLDGCGMRQEVCVCVCV